MFPSSWSSSARVVSCAAVIGMAETVQRFGPRTRLFGVSQTRQLLAVMWLLVSQRRHFQVFMPGSLVISGSVVVFCGSEVVAVAR